MKIAAITALLVNASEKSNWSFIRITTDDGVTGIGEASLQGWEPVQLAYLDQLKADLIGKTPQQALPLLRAHPHSPGGLVANSIISALEQAVTDIRAKAAGVPIHALLGYAQRKAIRIYANINRSIRDRTPAGFAKSAKAAADNGYTAIKIAPFDDVYWEEFRDPGVRQRLGVGMDRIFATREAIGPGVDLMIDCHWRFDEPSATQLIRDLEPAKLFWMECLVSENPECHAVLSRLRKYANEWGTQIAGAERQVGVSGFRAFVENRLMNVIMPDVKYAGGYAEMLHIAELAAQHGIAYSPHNPSGPLCTLATLHLCALAGNFLIMEHQLAESSVYLDIIQGAHPKLIDGCYAVPDTPGVGMELNDDALRAHPYHPLPVSALRDPRLG